jgi:DNA-directed RNA polymerase subunit RPC12/RpoP
MVRNVGGTPRPFGDDKKKKISINDASSKSSIMKGRLKTRSSEVDLEGDYYPDPMICDGCGKEFLRTIRNEGDPSNRRYCQSCASRIMPMNEMLELEKSFPDRWLLQWRTPINDLIDKLTIKEIEGMSFVDPTMNKRLIEMKMKKNV